MKKNETPSILDAILSLIILVCVTLMFLVSCHSTTKVLPSPRLHDSVRVEVHEKVIPIHDTLVIHIPAQTKSQATRDSMSRLETDFAISCARIDSGGTLFHTLTNKPQKYKAPVDTFIVTRDSIVYRDRDNPVPTPYPVEKELTEWEKLALQIGNIVLIGLILYILWRVWKIFR